MENFREGRISWGKFAVDKKVANPPPPPPPPANFSRRVANNFTANADAGEDCEFRQVQRCTRRREGTKMCLFATCGGDWNALKIQGGGGLMAGIFRRGIFRVSNLCEISHGISRPLCEINPLRNSAKCLVQQLPEHKSVVPFHKS